MTPVFYEYFKEPLWPYCAAASWFVQMGIHEGMHAQVAYKLGDPTADLMGKRSINPFVHIEWANPMSWIVSLILPIFTAFQGYIPMGLAWVPCNPYAFRRPNRDHALVALAGPGGNILLCVVCLLLHKLVLGRLPDSNATRVVSMLCCAIYITSIVYGIFNLIPVPPLDGSRVLYWLGGDGVRNVLDQIGSYGFLIVFIAFQASHDLRRGFYWIIDQAAILYG